MKTLASLILAGLLSVDVTVLTQAVPGSITAAELVPTDDLVEHIDAPVVDEGGGRLTIHFESVPRGRRYVLYLGSDTPLGKRSAGQLDLRQVEGPAKITVALSR
jgi:hypothetical protein